MKHIAQWIQSVQSRTRPEPSPTIASPKVTTAITPETVPPFVIPARQRKLGCCRNSFDTGQQQVSGANISNDSDMSSSKNELCKIPSENYQRTMYRKVASLPSQMCQLAEDGDTGSELEFPHLRTDTSSYGYTFVSETPNTHRKESLLMGGDYLEMLHQFQGRLHSCSLDSSLCKDDGELLRQPRTTPIEICQRQRIGRESASSSLPNKIRFPNDSPSQSNHLKSETDSLTSETSDLSSSPGGLQINVATHKSRLNVSLLYQEHRQQLQLKIIQAQNLMSCVEGIECNSYVKVSLEPGKALKHQTKIVRSRQNPVFDQSFTFSDVSKSDLMTKTLKFRVCNKLGSGVPLYSKRAVIGEALISLNQLELQKSQEHVSWLELEDISDAQCAARLRTIVELNKEEGQLYVTVGEVTNLRPTNTADSYVTIAVSQNGRSVVKKQTQVKRKNFSPIFNDIFAFSISTSEEQLSSTSITLKVMSKSRLRSDTTIGEVILTGSTSSEKLIFWSNLLNVASCMRSQWSELSLSS
ncbi:synaptotagmin-7-like isoform X2 [Watersipora subatra]